MTTILVIAALLVILLPVVIAAVVGGRQSAAEESRRARESRVRARANAPREAASAGEKAPAAAADAARAQDTAASAAAAPAAPEKRPKPSVATPAQLYLPPREANAWRPLHYSEIPEAALATFAATLPTLPIAAGRVAAALDDPQMNPRMVSRIVATDPSLAARLLGTVNSPFYALGKPTGDLRWAIVLLGYSQIKGIIFRSVLNETVSKKSGMGEALDRLWQHSYLVSVVAPLIAKEAGMVPSPNLSTAGLLLDVGIISLIARHPDRAKQVYGELDGTDRDFARREEESFGINHGVAGRLLANKWHLPEEVARLIESHLIAHFATVPFLPLAEMKEVAVIQLAEATARWYSLSLAEEEPSPEDLLGMLNAVDPLYFEVLGVTPPLLNLLTPPVVAALNEAHAFLNELSTASRHRRQLAGALR
jgi:HD-like signal output (HDOD) protein